MNEDIGRHFVVHFSRDDPAYPGDKARKDINGHWCDCTDVVTHPRGVFVLYTDKEKPNGLYRAGWHAGFTAGYEEAAEDLDPDGAIRAGYNVDE